MKKLSSSLFQNQDIILADRDYTVEKVGKCIEVTGITPTTTMIAGDHCLLLRPTREIAPYYLGYYLNSPSYHNHLIPYIAGTINKQITLPVLQETRIMYPSIEEQQKIGSFFNKLHNLINRQQRQTEKFSELKKGLLQKMFPQNGASVPQYRFPGFTGHLKPRHLKEVASLLTGYGNLTKSDLSPIGGTECITSSNLYTDYGMSISKVIYKTNKCINNPVYSESDDVLIPDSGYSATALGRAACIIKPHVLINGDVIILRSHKNINGYYLCMALNVNKIQLIRLVQGLIGKNIPIRYINDIELLLPESSEEQKQVGNFFKFWDRLIDDNKWKTQALSKLEAGLLHAMFPKIVD